MEELYRIALPEGVSTSLGARYTAEATTGLLHAWVTGGVDAEPEHLTNDLLALMPVRFPRLSRRADYDGRRGRRGLLRRPMRAGPDPDLSGRAHRGGAATPGFGSGRLTRGPRGDGHVFPLLQGLRPGLRCGHGRSDASGAPAEASAAGWGVPDGGAAEAPDRELAEADGPMVMLLGTTGPGSVSGVR